MVRSAVRRGVGRRVTKALLAVVALVGVTLGPVASASVGASPVVSALPLSGYGYSASDSWGNTYVVNYSLNQVDKVAPDGSESVFATINEPWSIAVDAAGNVYVDSFYTGDVEKVTPLGVVSAFASGVFDVYGMTIDTNGNLYANTYHGGVSTIVQVTPAGVVSSLVSPATEPYGLTHDAAGNLYFSDGGHDVYKVTLAGVVSLVASLPGVSYGLAMDSAGQLVVANYTGDVYLVSLNGSYSTIPLASAFPPAFQQASALSLDSAGNLFVDDWNSSMAFRITGFNVTVPAVSDLVVTSADGTLSATWSMVTGASGYECTLMFGYGQPSSFTVSTTTPTCSFTGLGSAVYGVSVSALEGQSASSAVVGFANSVPTSTTTTTTVPVATHHTIICQKGHSATFKRVSGAHPHCPSGFHRV